MIDPTQLPILLKAIDFVFDEGRKILEERRERRKANAISPSEAKEEPKELALPEPEKAEELKQDLLASKIDEILWQNHEWEIESLVKQLESHTQSYHILKEQSAKWGSVLVPPVIVIQLNEKENAVIETIERLKIILSKVYKKNVTPIK
jgi:hypothetical protein